MTRWATTTWLLCMLTAALCLSARADDGTPLDEALKRAVRGESARGVVVFVDEQRRRFPPSTEPLKECLRRFLPGDIRKDLKKAGSTLLEMDKVYRQVEFVGVSPRRHREWLRQFDLQDTPALLFFDCEGKLLDTYELEDFDSRPAARYRLRDPDLYALVLKTSDRFVQNVQETLLRHGRLCMQQGDYRGAQHDFNRLVDLDDESDRAKVARQLQQDILGIPGRLLEQALERIEQARVAEAMVLLRRIVRGFAPETDGVARARDLLVALRESALYDNYKRMYGQLAEKQLARAGKALEQGTPVRALGEVADIVRDDFDPQASADARKLLASLAGRALETAFNELSAGNLKLAESLLADILSVRDVLEAAQQRKADALKTSIQNSNRP